MKPFAHAEGLRLGKKAIIKNRKLRKTVYFGIPEEPAVTAARAES